MAAVTRTDDERSLVEAVKKVLPAGGFGNVASDIVIREGRGGRVWDVSGNEYNDSKIYVSLAHDEADVALAIDAFHVAAETLAAER